MKTQQTSGNAMKRREEMIYDSHYNRLALLGKEVRGVSIFDTTLRDGEQAPGIALSMDDKIRIASALSDLGVDVIEAGFAASGDSEKETIRKIKELNLPSKVCSLARSVKGDIDSVIDCDVDYVHTFLATSDIHLKYKLKMSREEVKAKAVDAIEYARSHGLTVQFSCEDATRTELDFLKEMHIAAQDAGASVINVPDTVGVIYPSAMTYLIEELAKVTKVPISVHCHNDMGLAVANSLAAVAAGAEMVHVCVNGLGERTGNAALEEIALGLYANFGVETVNMERIGAVSKMVSRITGYPIPYNKPIVGRNAFAHESGIHVHGVLNNAATYEAFRPELVGMDRHIILGKHSGAHSVRDRLNVLKVEFPDERMNELLAKIKEVSVGGKEIDDAELIAITDHILWSRGEEDPIKLKEFAVFTGKGVTATATVTVEVDGKKRTSSSIGIGPVDASINAIRCAVNEKITLEEYKLSAITGGSDSLCEATVVIKGAYDDRRLSVGKAVGLDIVATSVDATMEAINRDYIRGERS
ncbi:MAG: 2-isopropylmalate synthase [Methanomassiliicoccaceae archaeon]|nr:2-isopropylmalate synthase [Methanomassiliicoccaceae archaeon]